MPGVVCAIGVSERTTARGFPRSASCAVRYDSSFRGREPLMGTTRTLFVLLVGIAPVAVAPAAVAQATSAERGARIRLTVSCAQDAGSASARQRACQSTGTLAQWTADSLVLDASGRRVAYGVEVVRRIEIGRGLRTYTLPGAGIGFAAGSVGAFYALYSGGSTGRCNQRANQDAIDKEYCVGIYALGGLVGAGLGAIIGHNIRRESWTAVKSLNVGFAPTPLSVRASFAF